MKKDFELNGFGGFLIFLSALLILFFYPVLTGEKGYLYGDYRQQFYPWAYTLSESVKHFSLPLWAPEIGCGFPLLAEGQSGAFHPFNLLLYSLFPFPFSYQASFILLFFLAGMFYFYFSRKLGISSEGSALAAVIFLFGSSYAGFFYGIMMLRTVAWLPLAMIFVLNLSERPRLRNAALLAFAWALIFLGGYPQMAVYSVLAAAFFLITRLGSSIDKRRSLFLFAASLVLGAGLAACQLLPTLELVRASSRVASGMDFALEKSLTPLNLVSLLWPALGRVLRFDFYVGLLPLCLAVYAVYDFKKNKQARSLFYLALIFILLSFGRYNPFYVFFLKTMHLYFFRFPAKFLFFAIFWIGLLAGKGLDRFLENPVEARVTFSRLLRNVCLMSMAILSLSYVGVRLFKGVIFSLAEGFIRNGVYQKPGHPHSLTDYMGRLPELYRQILERTDPLQLPVLMTFAIWALIISGVIILGKNIFKKRNFILFVFGLTVLDLFCFSFYATGFRGNRVSLSSVLPDDEIQYLLSRPGVFRTYEAILDGKAPRWPANSNMLFGVSSVGLYSPLASENYRAYLKELGAVDNAEGAYRVTKESLSGGLGRLGFMNVKYLVSKEPLEGIEGLKRLFISKNGDSIYENKKCLPRIFFAEPSILDQSLKTAEIEEAAWPSIGKIRIDSYQPAAVKIYLEAPKDAFLFMSESYDSGWQATVDGVRVDLYRVNTVFRGLKVPEGAHTILMTYRPPSLMLGLWITVCSILILAACFFKKEKTLL